MCNVVGVGLHSKAHSRHYTWRLLEIPVPRPHWLEDRIPESTITRTMLEAIMHIAMLLPQYPYRVRESGLSMQKSD